MMAITSREVVAAEVHYHRTYYRLYTKQEIHQQGYDVDAEERGYYLKEKEAFTMLFNQIRAELFPHPHIESMVNLTPKLVANMHALWIENIKPQTKKHIRRKLETEFEDSIEIISDDKGKLLVIPDNLTRSMLVKNNMSLLNELA